MRLFAAVPVPPPARDLLGALLDDLRTLDWPVRWVRPEGVHLTLKFFGEVPAERLTPIAEVLRDAVRGTGPLPLTLTGLGTFPTARRARVVWVGLEAPPALELLQDRVERACTLLGFPVEGAPFRPHLTIGRVKDGGKLSLPALKRLREETLDESFLAEQVVLFESETGPGGSIYHARVTLPLEAA